MNVVIIDPNLTHENGHHLSLDLSLSREFNNLGSTVEVWTNKVFEERTLESITFKPKFHSTCYFDHKHHEFYKWYNAVNTRNTEFYLELSSLDYGDVSGRDIILVPTVNEFHFQAYMTWVNEFKLNKNCIFVFYLMFNPDEYFKYGVSESNLNKAYIKGIKQSGINLNNIYFFSGCNEYSRKYADILNKDILEHPSVIGAEHSNIVKPKEKKAILYFGDAKSENGFDKIPQVAQIISEEFQDWEFVIYANQNITWPLNSTEHQGLSALAAHSSNVIYKNDYISDAEVADIFERSSIILLPYSKELYKEKTSGVLWQAIGASILPIIPSNTWMTREADRWRYPSVKMFEGQINEIISALRFSLENVQMLRSRMGNISDEFSEKNSAKQAVKQILEVISANT